MGHTLGKRIFKTVLWVIASVVALLVLVAVALYIPPVQNWVKDIALREVRKSTGMDITVGQLRLRFPLTLSLGDVTVVEATGDTMATLGALDAKVALLPLLGGTIDVEGADARDVYYAMGTRDSAMMLRARVKSFTLSPSSMSLTKNAIDVSTASLDGGDVLLIMNDSVSTPADTAATESMPLTITAGKLSVKNVTYRMAMLPVIDSLGAEIPGADITDARLDMATRTIHARTFDVDSVSATYLTPSLQYLAEHPVAPDTAVVASTPDSLMWTVTADKVRLTGKSAVYATAGVQPLPGLDFSYLAASDIEIAVDSFYNRGMAVRVPLRKLSAKERSGLSLSASGLFDMDSTLMKAVGFDIFTAFSSLKLDAEMGVGDLTADPHLPLRLIANGNIGIPDIATAFPLLEPTLKNIPRKGDLALRADIEGTSGQIDIKTLSALLPGVASLTADGSIANAFDFDDMGGKVTLKGSFPGLNAIKPSLLDAQTARQVNLPMMTLHGTVDYSPGAVNGNLRLGAPGGDVALKADWQRKAEGYDADLVLDKFPVAAFMPNLGVGNISATAKVNGRGYDPRKPTTDIKADIEISSLQYLGLVYSGLLASAELKDNTATGYLASNNKDAEIDIDFTAWLQPDGYRWDIDGHVHHIDLMAMKITPTSNSGSLALQSTGTMNASATDINALATVRSLDWDLGGKTLYADSINIAFKSDSTVTARLTTGDLAIDAVAMQPLDSLLAHTTLTMAVIDSVIANKNISVPALQKALPQLDITLNSGADNAIVRFLAQDGGMSFNYAQATFRNDSLFNLNANVNGISAGTTRIDTLEFGAVQHGKFLAFKGSVNNRPGTLDEFAQVNLSGFVADDKAGLLLGQRNIEGERGFLFGLSADFNDTLAIVRFVPYTPTIGYKHWSLNQDNYVSYNFLTKHVDANLAMHSDRSSIKIYTEHIPDRPGQEDLVVQLSDIHLQDWLSISPFAPPIKGDLGADMRFHWNEEQLTGKGDVTLADLVYGRDKVGSFDLGVDVTTTSTGFLQANASLMVDSIKVITATGVLNDTTRSEPFMLDFSMIHFPLRIVNPFLPKEYASMSGMLNGRMDITGSISRPVFNGFLDFDSTACRVPMLGTTFTFSEDEIPVDSSIVRFNGYTITAANENPLKVDGTVSLADIADMKINLDMNARNMQIVNSSRPRKADVYGKAFIDLDASVKGDMRFIDVNANLKLLSGTNVTYIMTEAESALTSQSTGDMVKFVNFADTLAVAVADTLARPEMAMNFEAELTVQPGTTINVDLSTDGANKVSINGQGTLDYTLNPFSDGRLTGRFNINSGFVRYTPPMMSEKLFNFQEGSFVAFNGNMLNPILNIHAVDKLKANVTQQGQNSRIITFDVALGITNTLQDMNVAFDLSTKDDITVQNELAAMSPDQRATQAMNLLLYNVYQGPGVKANSNLGANPLYAFLEGQLNSWMANNIKGVDISFGIDQYDKTTDGSTSSATSYSYRVSKTLFNDRVKIIIGGNYSTDSSNDENLSQNLINDIAFEYMLNRSGSMIVRIFRHTGFESILEGEITETGVGFVMRRKINSLKDLFRWAGRLKRSLTGEDRQSSTDAVKPTETTDTPEHDTHTQK